MKNTCKIFLLCALSLVSLLVYAKQEKVIQIFSKGEVIQEYKVDEIDYIEINDFVNSPDGISAAVKDRSITVTWEAVAGATYNIYRSPDNKSFVLLASGLSQTSYVDESPLNGSNFYKVKAVVNGSESNYTATVSAVTNDAATNGIYLGIVGFNQDLYKYPIAKVDSTSLTNFTSFIDNLTMKNGTLLYYSVDEAINTLKTTTLPHDVSTIALITFTDGLDQGSMMKKPSYGSDVDYLNALNSRILNEKISGDGITAYSIGIRGSDVSDIDLFRKNLQKLASAPENATEVTSMAEVNAKFMQLAEQLTQSNYMQTINLKMPGVANGTLVRFTFDNVKDAKNSSTYIEGKFNLSTCSLEEVKYVGLTCGSGTTVKGEVDGIFVNFKFDDVHTNSDILIKSEFTDEWTYISSTKTWQINSEFDKTENSEIVTRRSSAVIMLVLDCSNSLGDQFVTAQKNAKDFINTLAKASGTLSGTESGEDEPKIVYSTKPLDLGIAVWKDSTRYYLTPEQYNQANLEGMTTEGLTVLSAMGNFIISPDLIQSMNVVVDAAMQYYSDILPDKNQATVISARYQDINNALSSAGLKQFSTYNAKYLTGSKYDATNNHVINLYSYTGGSLGNSSSGLIRGVKELSDTMCVWKNPLDLTLAVIKDGKRLFIDDLSEDLSQYDEVEGIAVAVGDQRFIVAMKDAQSTSVNVETAMNLYSDILPTYEQARVISMKYYDINTKLYLYSGTKLNENQYGYYLTKSEYNASEYYSIYLYNYTGGNLTHTNYGYVRGVKAF